MNNNVQPITEVLVPMDFSKSSRHALEFAKRIIEASHARLHLLSVDDDPLLMQQGTSQKARDAHEDKMAMKFIDCLTPDQRERYHTVMTIKCGTAYHEIEEYAREQAIDLIVIGRVGRSALADVMLGSVAAHVIRHAPCPVVAVRPEHTVLPTPPAESET